MKKTGKYEAAITKFLPESPKEWTDVDTLLLTEASTIDSLVEDVVGMTHRLANDCTRFADALEDGSPTWGDPMGSSVVRDITIKTARLTDAKDRLATLVRIHKGFGAAKELVTEVGR